MLVSTYVPTKMGPFFRPRYPFGWILKVLGIQKGQNIRISIYWLVSKWVIFASTCNSRYPNGSLFWFNPQNICILLITITLINIANIMFPVGFPVFTTCGAPHVECTLAQPRKTPAICSPVSSKFKAHNPPILWKRSRCCLKSRGGGGALYGKVSGISMGQGPVSLRLKMS